MNVENRKAYCIDARWLGYSKCSACQIRSSVLFADLDESDLDHLLRPIEHYIYKPQASLYGEGEASDSVFTIRSGVVKLVKLLPNGAQRVVRLLRRGDAAGLELLLDQQYHHTAVALTELDVCRIGTDVIRDIGLLNPKIHDQLTKRWQKNLDEADAFIVELSTGSAAARLARLLIKLADTSDIDEEGCMVPPREDIGEIIGTSTETASRIIAEFKRRGLVDETHNECLHCDSTALQKIALDDD
ncbi:MAG: Crp/Fnr family transcriptional regulator [Betaproteobacteria bacterium]|nr:MAG: Crp/Fnr family transcriptional regulator [Betaproteobacteria bacterium]